MTCSAFRGCSLENAVDVAAGARDTGMFAGQLEDEKIMIHRGLPSGNLVAHRTIRWGSVEDIIDVTFLARDIDMPPFKCKTGHVVINSCRCPPPGRVAGCAIGADMVGMMVILLMA